MGPAGCRIAGIAVQELDEDRLRLAVFLAGQQFLTLSKEILRWGLGIGPPAGTTDYENPEAQSAKEPSPIVAHRLHPSFPSGAADLHGRYR